MGISTVKVIVEETMDILWDVLSPIHMPIPTADYFMKISEEFYAEWKMPHCIGAVDGRHVRIRKPKKSGSKYYNYKRFFSSLLQALVGADYKYIIIDVGGYGSQSDGGTYQFSLLKRALDSNKLKLPKPKNLTNSKIEAPYFLIGDGAYPLSGTLMKPFPGVNLSKDGKIFNWRLSRARAVVENAFGHTCQKWRIFYTTIETSPEIVNKIVRTTCL